MYEHLRFTITQRDDALLERDNQEEFVAAFIVKNCETDNDLQRLRQTLVNAGFVIEDEEPL